MGDDGGMLRPPTHPMVGRVAERARLAELWSTASGGAPVVALISGDAGAGKTRLLEDTARVAAAAGGTVVFGSCVEVAGMGLPYLPIVDALRSVEATVHGQQILRQEAQRWPALARLLPHLVGHDDDQDWSAADLRSAATDPAVSAGQFGDALVQGQLFQALHRVLTLLAEISTVLLIIEDLHWADRSTRDLLSFLARTLREGRVALLASYRSDDLHRRHPLRPLLAELTRLPHVERIILPPFSRTELVELLDGLAGAPVAPRIIDQIFGRSEGNAFYAEELFFAAQDQGTGRIPDDLADVLLTKVQALPEEGREMLKVAAVAGRRADHDLLLAASTAEPEVTEAGLRQAVESGLMASDGDTYSFRHALVQEAVYSDLLPGERVRLHSRFALVLDQQTPPANPAELAHHRLAGHDLPGALAALLAAAAQAQRVAAPAESLRHLERAIELWQRLGSGADLLDLLSQAAEAAAASGEPFRATSLGRAAVQEADVRGGLEARVSARERLAAYLMESEDTAESAQNVAAEAAELLGDGPPTALRARLLAAQARTAVWSDPPRAVELLAEAGRVADQIGASAVAADALVTQALLVRRGLAVGDSAVLLASALARVGAGEDGIRVRIRALRFRSGQLLEDGRLDAALAAADEGVALADESGLTWSPYGLDLRLMRGWVLVAVGRWDEALAASLQAVYAPTALGRVLATQAFMILTVRGAAEAEQLLHRLRGTGDLLSEMQLDIAESTLRLDQGRPLEAIAAAEHGLELLGPIGWSTENLLLSTRIAAGRADLATEARSAGQLEQAATQAAAALALAEKAEASKANMSLTGPYGVLLWGQFHAEVARAQGADTADTWAGLALDADRAGRLPDRMLARWREARKRLEVGDRGPETVSALRTVQADARTIGAAKLLAEVESLVSRVRLELSTGRGSTPAARGPADGAGPLTAREVQVLRLVAVGRSNRQIGRELFISDKTASVHVSHIMEKLGAAGRTEAASLARERGLLAD